MELEWLKKSIGSLNCKQRMGLLEPNHKYLSVRQQCDLLSLNRSSLYYEQRPVSDEDLNFMRLLDEQYTQTPFYGVLRMTAYLRRLGYVINEKHVRRLLREMGLFSVYPKTNLSKQNKIISFLRYRHSYYCSYPHLYLPHLSSIKCTCTDISRINTKQFINASIKAFLHTYFYNQAIYFKNHFKSHLMSLFSSTHAPILPMMFSLIKLAAKSFISYIITVMCVRFDTFYIKTQYIYKNTIYI